MDFITVPELFLSLGAVASVFVAVAGLMILIATELTEDGRWFFCGVVVPLLLLGAGLFFPGWPRLVCQVGAGLVALGVPGWLAWRRPGDCLQPVMTGAGLLMGGGLALSGLLMIHFTHFAR
jgi:hypothetical protein